jgi:hypothetical protein
MKTSLAALSILVLGMIATLAFACTYGCPSQGAWMNAGIQNASITCVYVWSFHSERAVNANLLCHSSALSTYM